MSSPAPNSNSNHLLELTMQAFAVARQAAAAAADGIATGAAAPLKAVREYERKLDALDRDIDDLVTSTIGAAGDKDARQLLACMKFVIALERIGDLLLNFTNRAEAVAAGMDLQDAKELTGMATRLETMIGDVESSFRDRNLDAAVAVLRADAEMDRLCNLIMFRHLEPTAQERRLDSFHVLFMAQELERCGDHTKNMAEEVCHLISGRTVRHVLKSYEKPVELKRFIERLRKTEERA